MQRSMLPPTSGKHTTQLLVQPRPEQAQVAEHLRPPSLSPSSEAGACPFDFQGSGLRMRHQASQGLAAIDPTISSTL